MAEIKLDDLRQLLVENCMLRSAPEEITWETSLFGPGSLGLDSIDALQMTVGIERTYGVVIQDPGVAREAFVNLQTLQQWLSRELDQKQKST